MNMAENQFVRGAMPLLPMAVRGVMLAILLASVWLIVRAVLLFLEPASLPVGQMQSRPGPGPGPDPAPDALPATSVRHGLSFDPFHRNAKAASMEFTPKTTLDLVLTGVRTGADSSTVLQFSDGRQQVYSTGEQVLAGVRVLKIMPDHIILQRNGVRERLAFPNSDNNSFSLAAPGNVNEKSATQFDWATFAGAVRLKRKVEDGKVLGVELVQRNSTFDLSLLGLASGDILVRVGEEDLRHGQPEPDDLVHAFSGQSAVTIEFLRNGQQRTVKVGPQ